MRCSKQRAIVGGDRSTFILPSLPFVRHIRPFVTTFICTNKPLVGRYQIKGFTLIELIITLSIAGILMVVAVPAMTKFINNNRLSTVTNDFVGDLSLARSEALKRGSQAGVCKGNSSGCAGGGTAWTSGWIVFADVDENETWSANDVLLRVREALPPSTAITLSTGSNNAIIYGSQGQVSQGAPETVLVCNSKTNRRREIALITAGRHTVADGNC